MYKLMISSLLFSSALMARSSFDLFDHLDEMERMMYNHMTEMREFIKNGHSVPEESSCVQMTDQNNEIGISIKLTGNVAQEDMSVEVDDKQQLRVSVKSEHKRVVLLSDGRSIEIMSEESSDKADEKDAKKVQARHTSSSRKYMTLPHVIDVTKTKAVLKDGMLILTIPYKTATKIAIEKA